MRESKKITSLCGGNAIQITRPGHDGSLNLEEMKSKLDRVGKTEGSKFFLKFKVDNFILTIFKNGRVIIQGTSDENVAKSLYSRYIGE